ncbi:Holo-[acyl-carrier-protein] synthase [Listeria monocytogenes N53-1]|nr:Holo-[acyl-carrier-protein] synthase [Listeria monocytogenes]CCQ23420.1 Holo-[acyl-carrier-protein] synthase [Listeria monocytogenes N53-1]
MIKGIGLDMIDLERVKQVVEKNPRFIERVLTEKEIKQFEKYEGNRKIEYLAGRFAKHMQRRMELVLANI